MVSFLRRLKPEADKARLEKDDTSLSERAEIIREKIFLN